jgi:hypothetical protein
LDAFFVAYIPLEKGIIFAGGYSAIIRGCEALLLLQAIGVVTRIVTQKKFSQGLIK